jgi:hypothetical protein
MASEDTQRELESHFPPVFRHPGTAHQAELRRVLGAANGDSQIRTGNCQHQALPTGTIFIRNTHFDFSPLVQIFLRCHNP